MNRTFQIFLIFLFLSNCSLDNKTGFWTSSKKLVSENKSTEIIFKKSKIFEKEFNTNIKINLKNNYKKNSFISNLSNNNGIIDFDGKLKKISKFKFSKIKQFDFYQPELLISNKGTLIFFNDKGTIFNFDRNNKLIWKSNVYKKAEKKLKPILYFASNDKILIIADNLANFYAININNGKLIWSKRNSAPFNSQIKIYQDKFYVIDFENYYELFKNWIKKKNIKNIGLPYVTKGNWKNIYKNLILDNPSINFVYLHRNYDIEAWKFANKGFFNFKKHIPELISKL